MKDDIKDFVNGFVNARKKDTDSFTIGFDLGEIFEVVEAAFSEED